MVSFLFINLFMQGPLKTCFTKNLAVLFLEFRIFLHSEVNFQAKHLKPRIYKFQDIEIHVLNFQED